MSAKASTRRRVKPRQLRPDTVEEVRRWIVANTHRRKDDGLIELHAKVAYDDLGKSYVRKLLAAGLFVADHRYEKDVHTKGWQADGEWYDGGRKDAAAGLPGKPHAEGMFRNKVYCRVRAEHFNLLPGHLSATAHRLDEDWIIIEQPYAPMSELCPRMGGGLDRTSRSDRANLLQGTGYHDIDIVNAGFSVLIQWARMKGKTYTFIEQYVAKRSHVLGELHEHVTRKAGVAPNWAWSVVEKEKMLKVPLTIVLNCGGDLRVAKKALIVELMAKHVYPASGAADALLCHPFVQGLNLDIERLSADIPNVENCSLPGLNFRLERSCIDAAIKFVGRPAVRGLFYDGLLTSCAVDLDLLSAAVSQEVFSDGKAIRFARKKIF